MFHIGNGIDRLTFQTYVIVVGALNDGHFGLGINHALLQAFRQQETLLVDAVQTIYCQLAVVVELAVVGASLTESHVLDVGNEQFHLVVGEQGYRVKPPFGFVVVHAHHADESQVVECFGLSVVVGRGGAVGQLRIVGRRVKTTVVIGIRNRIQLVHRLPIRR